MRLFTLVPLATACAPTDVDAFLAALPDERLLVSMPTASPTLRVGEPSETHAVTAEVSGSMNLLIETVLAGVQGVTAFDPTWTDDAHTQVQWGPWSDDGVDGRLFAVDEGAGTYTWGIDAKPTGADDEAWVTIVAGESTPSPDGELGTGTFALDFDAIGTVDAAELATGQFVTTYDSTAGTTTVSAILVGFTEDGSSEPADAAYDWEQTDAGGTMDLALLADAGVGPYPELIVLRSRGATTGEGRGDALVTGGDLGALVVTTTDCWDASFSTTYWEDNATLTAEGDSASCAFPTAQFDPDF